MKKIFRAQIARISAGTHISPLGFYQFDDEEEGMVSDFFKYKNVQNLAVFLLLDVLEIFKVKMMKKQRLNSRKIRNLKESPSETWPTRA